MKSKILIPVDTARNSLTAEEYAIKLNWRMPMRVTLLTVLNNKRLQNRGISLDDQERILAGMRKRAQDVLEAAAKPFAKADVEYETRIEEGNPAAAICAVAQEEGYDMVIIAQSGLSEWEEILGGSVVHTLLNKCQAPVLLVKHSGEQLEQQRRLRAEQELLPR
ncbi:MAG: universal stress protein [Pseudomonadota bacterium]